MKVVSYVNSSNPKWSVVKGSIPEKQVTKQKRPIDKNKLEWEELLNSIKTGDTEKASITYLCRNN